MLRAAATGPRRDRPMSSVHGGLPAMIGETLRHLPSPPGDQDRLARRLALWLEAMLDHPRNLTALADSESAVRKHVAEPLIGWRQLSAATDIPGGPLIDVGSGNGAPGLPIALIEEPRPAMLLDSNRHAAEFLAGMPGLLDAAQIEVRCERAERVARGELRERFAVAVTRAAAPPPAALELILPFVRTGGVALAFTGDGVEPLESVAARLGGRMLAAPAAGLVAVRKERPAPARFPRRWAAIRRAPPA